MFSFKPFKAPGRDGLYPYFFQFQWYAVGHSVKKMCHEFFNTLSLPNNMNDTFLCFIPKFSYENHLKNFFPGSLCNTTCKIITKIITNCIKYYLRNLISPYQARFLKDHRACDNVILIQELMNHITNCKNRIGSIILKLDLEKAFDCLEWSFAYRTLLYFKFPPKITTLIMNCISSSNIVVLINGIQTSYFSPSQGIDRVIRCHPIFLFCVWTSNPTILSTK